MTTSGATTTTSYVGTLETVTVSGSTTTTYYYAAGKLIAETVNGASVGLAGLTYLVTNYQGSPTEALDRSGVVTASRLYGPYGSVRYSSGAFPTEYGYTGQRADAATGLDYYGARYYDPLLAQFTSADTVMDGFNRYTYVHGNPTSATDPSGHIVDGKDDDGGVVPPPPPPPTGGPTHIFKCTSRCDSAGGIGGSGSRSILPCQQGGACGQGNSPPPASQQATPPRPDPETLRRLFILSLIFDSVLGTFVGAGAFAFQLGAWLELDTVQQPGYLPSGPRDVEIARANRFLDFTNKLAVGTTILFGLVDAGFSGAAFYVGDTADTQDNTSRLVKSAVVGFIHGAIVTSASLAAGTFATIACGPVCGYLAGTFAGAGAGLIADWLLTPDHVNGALSAASQVADTVGSAVSGFASNLGGLFGL